MTGQMDFDSHIVALVDVATRLVNTHTGSHARGAEHTPPTSPAARVRATAVALAGDSGREPRVTRADADALAAHAQDLRRVFDAVDSGDVTDAAGLLNPMLRATGARPQLDVGPDGTWQVHFHGTDDSLAVGWAAGCATGLALAVGSSWAGRLGTCAADRCDLVFIDTSRNGSRRFCSTSCQNRTKTAAYRSRASG
ncbi:CGNR zinc finger domain-containing protein [Knoellia locipacati]|uniref:CGNR zinc finger domain-containing protein n=1 Tax=Knoellia locipacati TaxID=882824 RepID=UPI00384E7C35